MSNKNIVLIGMPGSGKTTIGKLLAKKLNRDFCDIDDYIEDTEGKKIKDIFKDGEDAFRRLEINAVREISKRQGIVISTGGGVVKFPENIDSLRKNGMLIFIDRSLDHIVSDVNISDRPLLRDGPEKLYSLYEERYKLYKEYADYLVSNSSTLESAVEEIIHIINTDNDRSEYIETYGD